MITKTATGRYLHSESNDSSESRPPNAMASINLTTTEEDRMKSGASTNEELCERFGAETSYAYQEDSNEVFGMMKKRETNALGTSEKEILYTQHKMMTFEKSSGSMEYTSTVEIITVMLNVDIRVTSNNRQ